MLINPVLTLCLTGRGILLPWPMLLPMGHAVRDGSPSQALLDLPKHGAVFFLILFTIALLNEAGTAGQGWNQECPGESVKRKHKCNKSVCKVIIPYHAGLSILHMQTGSFSLSRCMRTTLLQSILTSIWIASSPGSLEIWDCLVLWPELITPFAHHIHLGMPPFRCALPFRTCSKRSS